MKKTYLYIDGTNLFAGQYELFGPNHHLSFASLLKEIDKLVRLDKIFFYASYIGQKNRAQLTEQRKKLISSEALFYREAIHTKNLVFYKGHRSPTSGKEKGVDVHLSVDFLNNFRMGRKLPKQLKILSIKKPRMVNMRGR